MKIGSEISIKKLAAYAAVATCVYGAFNMLGFSTPLSRITSLENIVQAHTQQISTIEQDAATTDQKLDDAIAGLNRLLDAEGLKQIRGHND